MFRCLLALLLVSCAPSWAPPRPPPDNTAATLDSVVALLNHRHQSYCAGVYVRGVVITAAHCVDDLDPVGSTDLKWATVGYRTDYDYAADAFSDTHDFAMVYMDQRQDIALLIPMTTTSPPSEARLTQDGWWIGREVTHVGHSRGLDWTVTHGVISGARVMPEGHAWAGQRFLQVSTPVAPGSSGGPVFNRYGEVVGVVSFAAGDAHLAGAVPVETIRAALDADKEASDG